MNELRKSGNPKFADVGIADLKDILKDAISFGKPYWLSNADEYGEDKKRHRGVEQTAYLYEDILFAVPVVVDPARISSFYIPDNQTPKEIIPPRRQFK